MTIGSSGKEFDFLKKGLGSFVKVSSRKKKKVKAKIAQNHLPKN